MTSETWRPFAFNEADADLYDALHDDVPPWMEKSLDGWIQEVLAIALDDPEGEVGRLRRFYKIERELRMSMREPKNSSVPALIAGIRAHFRSRNSELVLTDYLLSKGDSQTIAEWHHVKENPEDMGHTFVGRLEILLKSSGSKWTVGLRTAGKLGLVQRVPEGVQLAADETMRNAGHAGERLAEAWGAAFGMNPDPAKAYALAVKAVEDAALPKVSLKPGDHKTLGSVIRVLNGTKYEAEGWTLGFQRDDKHYSNGKTLVAMLKTLWSGQTDRHGGDHELVTGTVITQQAAEAAVMLAVPLVQWFSSDFVVRSGTMPKLSPE